MTGKHTLAQLTTVMNAIATDAQQRFGGLGASQLNWKPHPQAWSIGQCFDHLITTNNTYVPVIEAVLAGRNPGSFWQKIPGLPGFWGRLLRKHLSPDYPRKSKTAKLFEPSSSAIGSDIIARFGQHQQQMIELMNRTAHLDLDAIIITSPALKFVTYNLSDCYHIIVVHEQRHVLQASRLLAEVA